MKVLQSTHMYNKIHVATDLFLNTQKKVYAKSHKRIYCTKYARHNKFAAVKKKCSINFCKCTTIAQQEPNR